ncbi:MAG: acyl-[acyl-carrier-protein]--UDP-N-acetylglucosamine O-acyltransferase [Deltaproteobacteria bacterium]|nr:acyl-ACP--UDP-N-acetylglucosamine O-acyltransferase [Deltaproteobacteria bacterium]MBW2078084.1 acyl-ACP--UDP-N-acetylglucosamine O-acyltransferase [Deltaproteobacteria bacterium]RLB31600.1 MAG: acyl-[acyl-carrier-protein]--UDP-N-acetylglucosamine O-acyltransferase [Deltaproteobacteria bacterium]
MGADIHPSAVVSPEAKIADGVSIGPFSVIGQRVEIGKDTVIDSHVVIDGNTVIGQRNRIYPYVSLGLPPQDVGYSGEDTRLVIGDDNVIREFVTVNRATTKQDRVTRIGSHNYLMAYAHVAHDCMLGNSIIMSNAATLGGHIEIGDKAIIGGLVAIHQFVRIGAYAFIGGMSATVKDIPPFMMASGARAKLYGLNVRGLKREGFSREKIDGLKRAYQIIWRDHQLMNEALKRVQEEIAPFEELDMLLDFLASSKRGVVR